MKVFAVVTILAVAVSAAPTKELCPAPIGPIPSYGLPIPPLNGGIPPLNGGNPPLNGVIPPVNGVIPPVNGVIPPVDGVIPPVDSVIPPVDAVIPPVSGGNGTGQFECPTGLYTNPQCCAADVLGLADLDCDVPSSIPKDGADFQAICAAGGKQAKCCVLPILGQDLLCVDAIGANN
ncbi:hypothetical protein TGAMA5MH_02079 [Trichoderma gamsii]|uniref:Hydrophobin n=1 Tax=Trichoderma gamsii TaxID=398673 RepID=A0A2K0TKI7_9HYPO|nr:hypothetical protein TGAMA5MH_02079 [Trichoderma gamsii]